METDAQRKCRHTCAAQSVLKIQCCKIEKHKPHTSKSGLSHAANFRAKRRCIHVPVRCLEITRSFSFSMPKNGKSRFLRQISIKAFVRSFDKNSLTNISGLDCFQPAVFIPLKTPSTNTNKHLPDLARRGWRFQRVVLWRGSVLEWFRRLECGVLPLFCRVRFQICRWRC